MAESWGTLRDFPEYESNRTIIRRKSDKKQIHEFWWYDEYHYALRDHTGRFRFIPYYEAFADVKYELSYVSLGPFVFQDFIKNLKRYREYKPSVRYDI